MLAESSRGLVGDKSTERGYLFALFWEAGFGATFGYVKSLKVCVAVRDVSISLDGAWKWKWSVTGTQDVALIRLCIESVF